MGSSHNVDVYSQHSAELFDSILSLTSLLFIIFSTWNVQEIYSQWNNLEVRNWKLDWISPLPTLACIHTHVYMYHDARQSLGINPKSLDHSFLFSAKLLDSNFPLLLQETAEYLLIIVQS
jgi:hypothetical protein